MIAAMRGCRISSTASTFVMLDSVFMGLRQRAIAHEAVDVR